jgi:hypothetical protein
MTGAKLSVEWISNLSFRQRLMNVDEMGSVSSHVHTGRISSSVHLPRNEGRGSQYDGPGGGG